MLRSLFRTGAIFALLMLALPAVPQAQSAMGLAYDEIARVIPSDATPPPPDAFAADLRALRANPAVAVPRKRGFFGGGRADDGTKTAPQFGTFGAILAPFVPGRLERHVFFNGWERVEDPIARTATIYKCEVNQVVQLDLDRKRYRITVPSAEAAAPVRGEPSTGRYDRDTMALGEQTIAGTKTEGYASIDRFEIRVAHGTCAAGTLSASTQTYYAPIAEPRRSCPLKRPVVPLAPVSWVAREGCTPQLDAHNTGPVEPVGRLSVFRLQRIGATLAGSEAPFGFLIERGNVRTLDPSEVDLFAIPPGYSQDR